MPPLESTKNKLTSLYNCTQISLSLSLNFEGRMNIYGEENPYSCYYHPKEIIIGICALCLKERLLILASKQSHFPSLSNISTKDTQTTPFGVVLQRKPSSSSTTTTLPGVFALGSSFLHRLDSRHHRPPPEDVSDDEDTLPSQDDSFISINLEDNGRASWDKKDPHGGRDALKSVIEHSKPPARGTLRWRRRIGHLFQLLRWRRPGKGRKKSWMMRSFTRKTTTTGFI